LGAVYKLTAFCDPSGGWRYPVKLSEHSAKISIPGVLGVRRFVDGAGRFRADMIYDEDMPSPADHAVIVDPADALHMRAIEPDWRPEELVIPVLRHGKRIAPAPDLDLIRSRARAQLDSLHPAIRRLLNPHAYPVGLERRLHDRRVRQVLERRLVQSST
jgi:nicotinate phosphoribosyltransferase